MGDTQGNEADSSPLPSEGSKKSKAKDEQTVRFPRGFREGPAPDGAGPGALAWEGRAQACKKHTTLWEPGQLSFSKACVAVATTRFHHKQLTTACRDVFLEETWQDVSHLFQQGSGLFSH